MVQCRRVGDKPNKFSFVNFCIEKTKYLNAFVKTQNQNMIFQTKKRYKNSFEWIVHFDKYVINWFVGLKVRIGILECCCLWIFIFILESSGFWSLYLGVSELAWFYQKGEWVSRKLLYFFKWRGAYKIRHDFTRSLYYIRTLRWLLRGVRAQIGFSGLLVILGGKIMKMTFVLTIDFENSNFIDYIPGAMSIHQIQ